jgi:cellulose synthase/poly-beta-1,6-N-acetylglucosamine synthase-like glycosyltransferase
VALEGPVTVASVLRATVGSGLVTVLHSIGAFWHDLFQRFGFPLGALPVGVALGYIVYRMVRRVRHQGLVRSREWAREEFVPTTSIEAHLYWVNGDRTVRVPSLEHNPSTAPPRSLRFVIALLLIFAAVASTFLLLYARIFDPYDHVVGFVGTLLYWPQPWPGVYGTGQTPLVYDYIFPMYLALIISWPVAATLAPNRVALPASRRWSIVGIFALYVGVELVIDAVFFTVPGLSVRNLSLIVRALTGGVFLTMIMYCTFSLPAPLARVPRRVPRDRRALWTFFGFGVVAVAIGVVALYYFSLYLQLHGILPVFTVLLLLPAVTVPIWALLNRPFYFRYLRRHPLPTLEEYHPSVSVIIPAFNEEEEIRDAILSADRAAAHYPGPATIVVGNDGSTDRTLEIARATIAELRYTGGMVLDLPHGGKSSALNGALRVAPGEVIVRLDADSRISEETGFGPAVRYLANPEIGGVQARIYPRQKDGWPRKLRAMEIAWQHLFLRPGAMATRAAEVIDGAFSVFRRTDLIALNGWIPWNGEDTEISIRLQRQGYRICLALDAQGFEDVPPRYSSLRKQRIRWTRGGVFANSRNYPALFSGTLEFGGLAVLFYYLLVLRAGARALVFVYLALLTVFLGVPGIFHAFYLLLALLVLRSIPLAYFLVRMRRFDALPWIPAWPVLGIVKTVYRFEAFGTILFGAATEFY